jgi:hypothetical protein
VKVKLVVPESPSTTVTLSILRFGKAVTVVFALRALPPAQTTGEPEQSGSVVPLGGTTVAVWLIEAAAAPPTVQVIVNVVLPPLAMAAPVQVPVPVTPGAMVPTVKVPADGVNVQPVSPKGSESTMLKVLLARTALGPALLMVSA